jgi:acetyl esterase/lipase
VARKQAYRLLSPSIIYKASSNLLGEGYFGEEEREGNVSATPFDANASGSWFDGLHKATKSLYVTTGRHEMLRDQIVMLSEAIRQRNTDVEVSIGIHEKEAHDFILVEGM